MAQFLEWYLTPESARIPRTLQEYADEAAVNVSTLHRYKEDAWFQNQLVAKRRGLFKVAEASKVIDSLVAIATNTLNRQAVAAARTLLEWMEKTKETAETIDLGSLTPEELLTLAQELYAAGTVDQVAADSGIE